MSAGAISLTNELSAELERANRPDEEIDATDPDVPEMADWAGAVRGKFSRSAKKPISLRVDADVLAWFQAQDGMYQRRMNEALREYMERHKGDRSSPEP
jgi:uncharacterized protein (DUF4415 family)